MLLDGGQHRLGALAGLLAGLEDHHQRARPLVLHRHQAPRGRLGGFVPVLGFWVKFAALLLGIGALVWQGWPRRDTTPQPA